MNIYLKLRSTMVLKNAETQRRKDLFDFSLRLCTSASLR